MIDKLVIVDSSLINKRLKATMTLKSGSKKTINFGSKNGFTYYDGADNEKRLNYLKRHKKNEDWNDILTAGALSRWILWEHTSIQDIKKMLGNRFKITNIKIVIPKNKKQLK